MVLPLNWEPPPQVGVWLHMGRQVCLQPIMGLGMGMGCGLGMGGLGRGLIGMGKGLGGGLIEQVGLHLL